MERVAVVETTFQLKKNYAISNSFHSKNQRGNGNGKNENKLEKCCKGSKENRDKVNKDSEQTITSGKERRRSELWGIV